MTSSRLPNNVRPSHYDLRLMPDLNTCTFTGTVVVDVEVIESTLTVMLNALELEIASGSFKSNGTTVPAQSITVRPHPHETATVQFSQALPVGPGQLTLEFNGVINSKLAGFYRSTYTVTAADGVTTSTHTMATTQFEATDARRAFPCWDEPALKATFDVTVVAPRDRLVLSNMPVESTKPLGSIEVVETRFGRSPVMSTYLLAFVVGEFDYVESTTPEGVLVRVYTPLGKHKQGEFALHVATKALSYYTRLFRIAYPLPKMDLLAVADFAAGAMENWGCIIFREVALLIDGEQSALDRRQRVARTVCHEIAHQWFGNLVTMEWWTHLWLNEGFARFLEFCAVDDIFPEWKIWLQFVQAVQGTALRHDALVTSHPIEVPVNHPDEINEIFDVISYAKGASVIRMLHDYLGETTFFNGLHAYLKRHEYSNASTEDLWTAMEEASGKQVKKLMGLWTSVVGYPMLKVADDFSSLTQQRYLSNGDPAQGDWRVPVRALLQKEDGSMDTVDFGLIENDEDGERVVQYLADQVEKVKWIKLNASQVGFYRVLYSQSLRAQLAQHIAHMPVNDRLGLLMDAFALTRSGHLSVDQLLITVQRYRNDREYTVWSEITSNLEALNRLFSEDSAIAQGLSRYTITLCESVLQWLQGQIKSVSKEELGSVMQFYSIVHGLLVLVNEPSIIQSSLAMFAAHHRKDELIHPDLRQSVYTAYVQAGGKEAYETILNLYESSDLSEERRRCLQALGAATDSTLLRRTMELSLSPLVRPQDVVFPMAAVSSNIQGGHRIAWDFFVERFSDIDKGFNTGGQSFLLSGIVSAVAHGRTDAEAAQVEAFFTAHPWPAATKSIQSSLESTRIAAKRIARDRPVLLKFFV